MDENLVILLILVGVAVFVGGIFAVSQSRRVRTYGVLGALRRKFSGGGAHSDYNG